MSAEDDRRRMKKAIDRLDSFGALRGQMPDQEIAERSMEGIIAPQVLGQYAERRTELQLRALAQKKGRMDFSDVKQLMMGCWAEGFMAAYHFTKAKLEGE